MRKKRLLVTGASGLLGINLTLQQSKQYDVIGVINHTSLTGVPFEVHTADLAQPGEAARLVEGTRPDLVVNCAALAIVDRCEKEPDLAQQLNADMPEELAAVCGRVGIPFVHISTDALFDGSKGDYNEQDQPNPINQYALSKLAGDEAVLSAYPQALVARVNFFGWSLLGKRSLAEFFYYSLSQNQPVKGFTDVFFCPMEVNDLADALVAMVEKELSGLYHVFSPQSVSKYDFANLLARQFGFDETLISPTKVADFGLAAARSPLLTMDSHKAARDLGHELPGFETGMRRFYELEQAGYPRRLREFVA
jgi:dTDP-4-dehydrorhamnose reductase